MAPCSQKVITRAAILWTAMSSARTAIPAVSRPSVPRSPLTSEPTTPEPGQLHCVTPHTLSTHTPSLSDHTYTQAPCSPPFTELYIYIQYLAAITKYPHMILRASSVLSQQKESLRFMYIYCVTCEIMCGISTQPFWDEPSAFDTSTRMHSEL